MSPRLTLPRTRWLLAALACVALFAVVVSMKSTLPRSATEAAAAKAQKKSAKKKNKRPAQAVVARGGTPTLRRKLATKEPLVVAFIGGSITQNAGGGGFVKAVPAWLQAQNPGIAVQVINAGIAATGSDFGAQRVERDVLVHQPAVVFVEFAVNDADRDCRADFERLVRKIRLTAPQTDIVLLYTITDLSLGLLEHGKFPPSVQQHESVAQHYGLPTVALGFTALGKVRRGEWKWADFSPDYCHPTTAGYASYNQDLEAALPLLLAATAPALAPVPPSLAPDLVVFPPAIPPVAQPLPRPLHDAHGNAALATSELPRFGVHWTEAPEFSDHTGAVWRLSFRRGHPQVPADASAGLERPDWRPQRWFEEARSFTGNTSQPLAKSDAAAGNQFGANPVDSAVLTWRAPTAGRYLVRAAAAALEGGGHDPAAFAGLNLVRFSRGAEHGESLAAPTTPRAAGALELSHEVVLAAGDELALVFFQRGFDYAYFHGFQVTIGFFGPATP